jgi:hypothetical protein
MNSAATADMYALSVVMMQKKLFLPGQTLDKLDRLASSRLSAYL